MNPDHTKNYVSVTYFMGQNCLLKEVGMNKHVQPAKCHSSSGACIL